MKYDKYIIELNPLEWSNIPRVENLYNRNQFLIRVDDRIYFQSYENIIAFIHNDEVYIDVDFINYSKTTSKHLYIFLREYTKLNINNLKDLNSFIKRHFIKLYRA